MRSFAPRFRRRTATSGYTLLELLLVLAMVGLFVGWTMAARPGRLDGALASLRGQVVQARFEATLRNAPVAVVYRPAERSFITLAGEAGSFDVCEVGAEVSRLQIAEFAGVEVESVPSAGLVWLPSGNGRTCSGAGVFNQTIVLMERGREGRVIISRAGRVRTEVEL